jgi:Family of unknown function (DUF5636)
MQKVSPEAVGAELRRLFPHFESKDKFKGGFAPKDKGSELASYAGDSKRFHDFCQIGALLSDEARCMGHLVELNKRMAKKLLSEMPFQLQPNPRLVGLATPPQRLTAKEGKTAPPPPHGGPKYFGALRKVLHEAEHGWGFNTTSAAHPDGEVMLTGFVAPRSFEQLLLQQARHWKDPGTTLDHGEYTHRLQWWVICREHETRGPYRLAGEPVDRFRQMPKYISQHWRANYLLAAGADEDMAKGQKGLAPEYTQRTMWDYLFDAVPTNDYRAATTPGTDTFRSPQNLNRYLTSPEALKQYPGVLLLHCYLVNRYNKRARQPGLQTVDAYTEVLCAKWGISQEEFKRLYADESIFGASDSNVDAEGRIIPRRV